MATMCHARMIWLNFSFKTSKRSMWMIILRGINAKAYTGWPNSQQTNWTLKEAFPSSAESTQSNFLKL